MKAVIFAAGLCLVLAVADTAAAGPPARVDMGDLWDTAEEAQADQREREGAAREDEHRSGPAGMQETAERMDEWFGRFQDARDLYDEWDSLDRTDDEMVPEYGPEGSPRIPSRCAASEECRECYRESHEQLENVRRLLEKLRIIMARTRAFTDAAIAFGDNTSGVHAVSGMAWQSERAKILETFEGTKKAYDNKYAELMASLKQALMGIAKCEGEFFDTPDWFDRFGFIYYQFMEDRYRRQ